MRRESQGLQHVSHLFVESRGDRGPGEMPPTKMWQRSGMGHLSKGDSKGHPLVEENLERRQIPNTHTIKSADI